jgi:ATP-dependent RNA helicase DHX37/DHR1
MHEREIMENIENFVVTIVCGETGSGKSTQIPKFVLEAQSSCPWKFQNSSKGLIGITQPRRVAAVSLAQRVSEELGKECGSTVGYQIRFDNEHISKETKIKFMTDGILLKEIETDFMLSKYACIMVDEAHERSLNSDILVSLLTRIAHARCELAL